MTSHVRARWCAVVVFGALALLPACGGTGKSSADAGSGAGGQSPSGGATGNGGGNNGSGGAVGGAGSGGRNGGGTGGNGTGSSGGRNGAAGGSGAGSGGRSGGGTGGFTVPDAGLDAFTIPDAFSFDAPNIDALVPSCAAGVSNGSPCVSGTDRACAPATGTFCFCQNSGTWLCL